MIKLPDSTDRQPTLPVKELETGAEYFDFVPLGTPLTGIKTPRVGFLWDAS